MRDFTNGNQVQTFTYDDLNRLKTAGTTNVGAGQYSQSYSYDQIGNLLTRSTTLNSATTTWNYAYSTKPHAVTSMTGDATNQSFGYRDRKSQPITG